MRAAVVADSRVHVADMIRRLEVYASRSTCVFIIKYIICFFFVFLREAWRACGDVAWRGLIGDFFHFLNGVVICCVCVCAQ